MKINYEKKLNMIDIRVVKRDIDRDYYYPNDGIVVEIGGMERFTDPTIWRFETEILAQHFFSRLFRSVKIMKALSYLNMEILRFKQNNPIEAKERLHKIFAECKNDLLRCIGYESGKRARTSIVRMMESCGKNYEVAVHENVACFLLGIERNTRCHSCKLAKFDPKIGWLKCDEVYKHIPRDKIIKLPNFCVGEFTMIHKTNPFDKKEDLYTNICLFEVNNCKKYKFRKTPVTTFYEVFTF